MIWEIAAEIHWLLAPIETPDSLTQIAQSMVCTNQC